MILVGIDVAKDKHDCFIQTADGKVLFKAFSFANNYEGFEELYAKILSCNDSQIRVGLESTGHYSYNLLGFLLSKELPTFLFNPRVALCFWLLILSADIQRSLPLI